MVRAKFCLTAVTQYGNHAGKKLIFTAQYDNSIEEDRRFAKATPNGSFEMFVDNPAALAFFEIGKYYYFDASPVPAAAAAAE